jgi:O-antigen/teichoic acid export membrane protein
MSLGAAARVAALQSVVQLTASFLSVKVTAVYLGPAGLGVVGQMVSLLSMLQGTIVTGVSGAVIKGSVQADNEARKREVMASATWLVLATGLLMAIFAATCSGWLSEQLLQSQDYGTEIAVGGFLAVAALVAALLPAIAIGYKDVNATGIQVSTLAIAALAFNLALCPSFGVKGGIYAALLAPVVALALTLLYCATRNWFSWAILSPRRATRAGILGAAKYMPIGLVQAALVPAIQVFLRNDIGEHQSAESVGLVQAVWRLSDVYMGLFMMAVSMHFKPRIAAIQEPGALKRACLQATLITATGIGLAGLGLWLFKRPVISLIFQPAFLPAADLIADQVLGNAFRAMGWIAGYVILARFSARVMFMTEAALPVIWLLTYALLGSGHTAGDAVQSYAVACLAWALLVFGVASRAFTKNAASKQERKT